MKKDISDKNNSCNCSSGSTPARPSVAVVMCTYNGEKFLREQLDSILYKGKEE